jgi:hypothetical protein
MAKIQSWYSHYTSSWRGLTQFVWLINHQGMAMSSRGRDLGYLSIMKVLIDDPNLLCIR